MKNFDFQESVTRGYIQIHLVFSCKYNKYFFYIPWPSLTSPPTIINNRASSLAPVKMICILLANLTL